MGKFIDLTGQRFERLKVIKKTIQRDSTGCVVWECECDCGNTTFQPTRHLNSGAVLSCGCLKRERAGQRAKYIDRTISAKKLAKRNKTGEYSKKMHKKYDFEGTVIHALTAKKSKANKSGYKGVCFIKSRGKYLASIGFKGKSIFLGYYDTLDEAICARKLAEKELFDPIIDKYNKSQREKR